MPSCDDQLSALVEGADYEVDLAGGRIRFLSSGQLGALSEDPTFCGVKMQICCTDPGCAAGSPYACDAACYVKDGYDTVMQQGAEAYKTDDEKVVKMMGLESEPLPQSTPSPLRMEIGYAATPSCFTWKPSSRILPFACQTELTAAQRLAQSVRRDGTFYFPTWRRGRYVAARFRISGVGGGGTFSALSVMAKGWGQQDSP